MTMSEPWYVGNMQLKEETIKVKKEECDESMESQSFHTEETIGIDKCDLVELKYRQIPLQLQRKHDETIDKQILSPLELIKKKIPADENISDVGECHQTEDIDHEDEQNISNRHLHLELKRVNNKEYESYEQDKNMNRNITNYSDKIQKDNTINAKRQPIQLQEKPFKCDICGKTFTRKFQMMEHLRIHTGEKPFKCDTCGNCFTRNRYLISHMSIHTGENPFKCDICEKSFILNSSLKEHMIKHTGEKPFNCDICGKYFTRKYHLKAHQLTHYGENPLKCTTCEKTFSTRKKLISHLKSHTQDNPFKCDFCGQCFTKGNYKRHLRSHTLEKSFNCDICGKYFTRKDNLKEHLRIHSGEKPFKCTTCGKPFSSRINLNTHMKSHSQEKPYKCDICEKFFKYQGNLKTHVRKHIQKKLFKCHTCKKVYVTEDMLNLHVQTHTEESPAKAVEEELCDESIVSCVDTEDTVEIEKHISNRDYKQDPLQLMDNVVTKQIVINCMDEVK